MTIKSKVPNNNYRDGWDRLYANKIKCKHCGVKVNTSESNTYPLCVKCMENYKAK